MKTLFNNLLLNHRFVFQENNPGEQLQKAAEAAAQPSESADAELDALVGQKGSNQDFNDWFDREIAKTEEKGKGETDKAQKDVASLNIEQYLKPLGSEDRPIQLEEIAITGNVPPLGSEDRPIQLEEIAITGNVPSEAVKYVRSGGKTDLAYKTPEEVWGTEGEQLAQAATEAQEATEQSADVLLDVRTAINNLNNFKDVINAQIGKGTGSETTADLILSGIKNKVTELVKQKDYKGLADLNRQINTYNKSFEEGSKDPDRGTRLLLSTAKNLQRLFG